MEQDVARARAIAVQIAAFYAESIAQGIPAQGALMLSQNYLFGLLKPPEPPPPKDF